MYSRVATALAAAALTADVSPQRALASPATSAAHEDLVRGVDPAGRFGINEAFEARRFALTSGARWTRWTVQWFNVQPQPGGLNGHYFRDAAGASILEEAVRSGLRVAAMILGTPEWAAERPGLKTGTSVPRGLYEPVFVGGSPNPANTWGSFIYEFARTYRGLMDVYEIWNEPEIPAYGSNALYHTWAGSAGDYYRLLKVASEAAPAANPDAVIVTAPYAYFRDKQEGQGALLPWFETFADAVRSDPAGASVFDVLSLNCYRNAHDLWDRMHGAVSEAAEGADTIGFRERLETMGAADKPIWVTETNSMPFDEELPGWDPKERYDYFRITKDEQASYVIQAYAIGLAAGYDKIFFQSLQDDRYPVPDELWGLVRYDPDRDNGEPARARPAFAAYQVAAKYLGNADWVHLQVHTRPDPQGMRRYASRFQWAGHLAAAQRGPQRAHVLWNGTAAPLPVALRAWGTDAKLVDKYGNESPLTPDASGRLHVTLEPASRRFVHPVFGQDPPDYFYVGGSPLVVVEQGVPPDAPVEASGFADA
jgi:hypothetical protein